jgi:FkbM family methyltransferase
MNIQNLRNSDQGVFNEVVLQNCYGIQPGEFANVRAVLDVGAYTGTFAYVATVLGQAPEVWCYEANPSNYADLKKAVNDDDTAVCMFNLAITATVQDSIKLSGDKNTTRVTPDGWPTNVASTTLEKCACNLPVEGNSVLKMDIEGGEYEVLFSSSRETLRKFSTIYLETHDSHTKHAAMVAYLSVLGFNQVNYGQLFKWDISSTGAPINYVPLDAWVSKFVRHD